MCGCASPIGKEHDGCPVARRNVRRVEREAVTRLERDLSGRRPERRRRCLSARPMGRDDRNRHRNDEPDDKERGQESEPNAAGDPTAAVVAGSPEEARTGNHERSPGRSEHEAGSCRGVHVTVGDLGRSDAGPYEGPDPEHERGHCSPARACAEYHHDREPEYGEGDHGRDDVVAQARPGRRCRRDGDDVESDGRNGRHEDGALPRRGPAHAPRVDELFVATRRAARWIGRRRRRRGARTRAEAEALVLQVVAEGRERGIGRIERPIERLPRDAVELDICRAGKAAVDSSLEVGSVALAHERDHERTLVVRPERVSDRDRAEEELAGRRGVASSGSSPRRRARDTQLRSPRGTSRPRRRRRRHRSSGRSSPRSRPTRSPARAGTRPARRAVSRRARARRTWQRAPPTRLQHRA